MSDYIEVLDETDPRSNLDGDTLIHTDMNINLFYRELYCKLSLPVNTRAVHCMNHCAQRDL